jgi:NitT/TauT family transport system ATP-binding protein
MAGAPHISIEGVGMVYETASRPLVALDGISLSVQRGEFVSIIGPSGCGKSTLLRIVGGLQTPSRGRVAIESRPPREAQWKKQIGCVFQDASLLPWRNVIDNVRLPLQVNRHAGAPAALTSASTGSGRTASGPARFDEAHRLVELVGLDAFRSYYPHQLSGGMQQRVALARSLVTAPSLLLMDEPFGALDEITRSAMRYELLRVWRSQAAAQACTVLFVTHSIAEAVLLSDRVVVLTPQPGRIAATLDIDLPRPRDEDVEVGPAFLGYTRQLRSLLRERSVA